MPFMAETTPSLDRQHQEALSYLEMFHVEWSEIRGRNERCGGLDHIILNKWKDAEKQMNHLLEDYFLLNSGVVFITEDGRGSE